MRSRNVGEMVIHELIREYLMKFDTNMNDTLGFSFAGKDIAEEIYDTASSWLKAVLASAGGIFVYRNKAALEGLGTIVIEKVKSTTSDAVVKILQPESRIISEATYDSRFEPNVKSEGLEEVAKKLVDMIKMDIHAIQPAMINIDDEASLNSSVTAFNNDAAKSMKMIIDLCTNSARSYPNSLSTFSINAPPLPDDITDNEQKKIAGYLLLDVASIQLNNILRANITTYYDKVKEELDKKYKPDDDMNKTLTKKIVSLLTTLSTNLNSIMLPARDVLVKPK